MEKQQFQPFRKRRERMKSEREMNEMNERDFNEMNELKLKLDEGNRGNASLVIFLTKFHDWSYQPINNTPL